MDKRIHIFIEGRVQGVFFRDSIKRWAERKNVRGWARNLKDGRVECVFEGESEDVEFMLDYCKRGPPLSRIEKIIIQDEPYSNEFESFEIRF